MTIRSTLTFGWPTPDSSQLTADSVLGRNGRQLLLAANAPVVIHNCGSVFRRRTKGFDRWKSLCELLGEFQNREFVCQYDAFAFAFLATAKNADLLLPVDPRRPFARAIDEERFDKFFAELASLSRLESSGIAPSNPELVDRYLPAREILSRQSCTEERRVIATLLVSGPSTDKQIADDLGISTELANRVLRMLLRHGCVSPAVTESSPYAINRDAIAVTYYLIQETIGFSLSEILEQYVGRTV